MQKEGRQNERLVALVLIAALAFNGPLLSLFDSPVLIFGIPVLYLYLFIAWAVLIGLVRSAMQNQRSNERERDLPQQKQ